MRLSQHMTGCKRIRHYNPCVHEKLAKVIIRISMAHKTMQDSVLIGFCFIHSETVHTFKILPTMTILLSLYHSVCAYGNSTGISITSVCSSSVRHHLAVGLSNGDVEVFVGESPEKEDSPNTLAQTKVTANVSVR